MSLEEIIKLCEERLGKRVRYSEKPYSTTFVEGEVEFWMIQRKYGRDPEPFLQLKDQYHTVSLYQTELLDS